jgi:hypothetical protein
MNIDLSEFPRPDPAMYTTRDFELWREARQLDISPKFQRRSVWRTPARSLFIDTMLRGMIAPPIYLRWAQDEKAKKPVRQVVDGQQRVRSALEYIDEKYRLSRTLNAAWSGKLFSELEEHERDKIMEFRFSTETFQGISDQQVLEVFSRLNMNGLQLNAQELRNGRYFGLFKQLAYQLALDYLALWREHKIFSEQNIARMLEVELTSELLIAGRDGMQDKKKTISDFYSKFEDVYPDRDRDEKRFREVMGTISETFSGDSISETEFSRAPLFYTLYCVVYHRIYGLTKIQTTTPKKRLTIDDRGSLREATLRLSDVLADSRIIAKERDTSVQIGTKYAPFIVACQRQTDNYGPRKDRFDALYDEAF